MWIKCGGKYVVIRNCCVVFLPSARSPRCFLFVIRQCAAETIIFRQPNYSAKSAISESSSNIDRARPSTLLLKPIYSVTYMHLCIQFQRFFGRAVNSQQFARVFGHLAATYYSRTIPLSFFPADRRSPSLFCFHCYTDVERPVSTWTCPQGG